MSEEKNIKLEAEALLLLLRKEKLIEGATRELQKTNKAVNVSQINSTVQIEGDMVIVHIKDKFYKTIATFRVYDNHIYERQTDTEE